MSIIIEETDKNLDEILFFLDEFEGGSSNSDRFDRVICFVVNNLNVGKENAQRLYDFFLRCRNRNVYLALIGDFGGYLTEKEKNALQF